MKRRIPESWLSAYLDGELDASRRALVAKLAAKHPAIARRLDEMRRINAAVASLPKAKLAGDARARLWSEVLEHADLRAAGESAPSACFDGELTQTQAELVEARTSKAQLAAATECLAIGDALRDLPSYSAPAGAVAEALKRIKLEVVEGAEAAAELRRLPIVPAPTDILEQAINEMKPLHPAPKPVAWFAWRREGWATGLAAALLTGVALAVYSANRPLSHEGPSLADVGEIPDVGLPKGVAESNSAPILSPRIAQKPVVASDRKPAKPAKENDPFIDPHLMPEAVVVSGEKKLPPELPEKMLKYLRPGAQIEVPGTTITFTCLDVQKMKGRLLEVVLLKTTVGKNITTKDEADGAIVRVEIEATPSQMGEVLAGLRQAEDTTRLIADMDVQIPKSIGKKAPVAFKEPMPLANVRPDGSPEKENAVPAPKESPTEVAPLPTDAPRQYLLVFRRQEPATDEKKKG